MAIERIDVFRTFFDGSGKYELTEATVEDVEWVLNQEGSVNITIDPLSSQAELILLNEIELQIWFNDHIQHYVVPRGIGGGTDKVSFACEGILSWFQYAFLLETINEFSVEQFDLAVNLIDWAQSQTYGDRRIDIGAFAGSGIFRGRPTLADDFPNIYDLLQEFPTLDQGFDFDIKLFDDGRREFWCYYPSKGSYKPQYSLEFDIRGRKFITGIEDWKVDGFSMATDVYNTGGTVTVDNPDPTPDDEFKVVGHFEDVTANGSPKYGKMTKVMSDGQIIDLGWLNDRAKAEESLRGQPITTASLAVTEDLLGLIETGDTLPVNIDYGVLRMKGIFRIMSIKWRNSSRDLLLGLQPA